MNAIDTTSTITTIPNSFVVTGSPQIRIQRGKKCTPEENAGVVAFLKTLPGDQPNFKRPILPPSSGAPPRPQPFAKK